jgi:C-terminal processing protease CtpA/Prc
LKINKSLEAITKLDKELKLKIVKDISKQLLEMYVFKEKAMEIERKLNEKTKSGLFDNITDIRIFTNELNKILLDNSKDKHLTLEYNDPYLKNIISHRDCSKEEIEKIKQEHVEKYKKENFGFRKLEILEGNIGYIDLRFFDKTAAAFESAKAAMKFLANTESIIFDLRKNNGGEFEMIVFLASHFLESGILWNTVEWPYKKTTEEFWISDDIDGKKMIDVDLYVLTSKDTFSGGEDFAYGMKCLKRALLIGETTKGGAHPTASFSVLDLLVLNIPRGRSINPISKTNWEVVGVKPDISIKADLAYEKAYELALKKSS